MVLAIDINQVLRTACESHLAAHIRARLVASGAELLKGSPEGQAKFFVKRWTDGHVRAFHFLVESDGKFLSKSELGAGANSSERVVHDFWRRTLKSMRVAARISGTTQRKDVPLFRRGHEMFWSAFGIKMQIRGEMPSYQVARTVTETTRPALVASMQNYEGATAAQEADESRSEEERAEPRERLKNEVEGPMETAKRQGDLFGAGGQ